MTGLIDGKAEPRGAIRKGQKMQMACSSSREEGQAVVSGRFDVCLSGGAVLVVDSTGRGDDRSWRSDSSSSTVVVDRALLDARGREEGRRKICRLVQHLACLLGGPAGGLFSQERPAKQSQENTWIYIERYFSK